MATFSARLTSDSTLSVSGWKTAFPLAAAIASESLLSAKFREPSKVAATLQTTSSMYVAFDTPRLVDPVTGKTAYKMLVVDRSGTAYGELENVTISSVSWAMNGEFGGVEFSLPIEDPKNLLLVAVKFEVQVWRGTQLLWWGPVLMGKTDQTTQAWTATSLDWYFSRRFIGATPKVNLLRNGSFEDGFAYWEAEHATKSVPNVAPVYAVSDDRSIEGGYSLMLQTSDGWDEVKREGGDVFDGTGSSTTLSSSGTSWINAFVGGAFGDNPVIDVTVYHDASLTAAAAKAITDARVEAIRQVVMAKRPRARFRGHSMGESKPYVASNKDVAGRQQNRRVIMKRKSAYTGRKRRPQQWVEQEIKVRVPASYGAELPVVMRGWAYIDSLVSAAPDNRSMEMVLVDPSRKDPRPWARKLGWRLAIKRIKTIISKSSPQDTWIRQECVLSVPSDGKTYAIKARLWALTGKVYWDDIAIFADGSLRYAEGWQTDILYGLVQHLQDPSLGKSDLNIGFRGNRANDTRRSREYKWVDRQNGLEIMNEFATLADGAEWAIEVTPTTRTLVVYPYKTGPYGQVGGRGRRHGYALVLGDNLVDATIDTDGSDISTSIIVQKEGEGIAREEGYARDTSGFDGLVLEKVYDATPSSSTSSLKPQAERGLARYRNPSKMPTLFTHPDRCDELLANVGMGDVVPVVIQRPGMEYNGLARIIGMTLDPASDMIAYTLSPQDA